MTEPGAARPLAVCLTPLEGRREVVLHVAERAEELGYDGFYLAEGWSHDAGVLLAEVATRTSTIRIGTSILNTWGRSAAGVAMLATSLAAVSGGRFTLGLGAGSPSLAEGLHNVEFDAPVARLGSVTREVRRLLRGERATSSFSDRPLRLGVRPESEIPINLAALGPSAVRLTGEVADGWLPFLLPRSGLGQGIQLLREGMGRGDPGRPLPRVCPGLPLAVAPDYDEARKTASWWLVFYLVSMGPLYREALARHGLGDAVAAVLAANPGPGTSNVPDSAQVLIDELTVCGDPEGARAALDSWYDAGADVPALTLPPGRDLAELDYLLEVMRPTPVSPS